MTSTNDRKLDQAAIERLEAATLWLITEATPRLFAAPDSGPEITRELIAKHRVGSYIVPGIGEEYEIVRYIPKSRGLYYDISLLTATEHAGRRYEYWVVFRLSKDWATPKLNDCRFIITSSNGAVGIREIVENRREFFHNFRVSGTTIFDLDYRDPKLRSKLGPQDSPGCFADYPELMR